MNEASKEDIQLLEDWISSDAEHHSYFEQIRDTWNSIELENELDEKKVQSDLRSMIGRIEVKTEGTKIFKSKTRTLSSNWLYKAAAVFILGFAASWFVFQGPKLNEKKKTVYNDIETPKGSSTIINLPDGSKIWLNAGSKLRYPQNFDKNERSVFLEGEAFFEVSKDKDRKFLVKTSELTVKVFGTKFNVKSYPDESAVETTLVEGSISIQKNSMTGEAFGKEIKMEPNQRIVLYKAQKKSVPTESRQAKKIENVPERKAKLVLSKRIDTKRFTSWKDGKLIIKSEPMMKLAVTLERKYNVRIHFEDEKIKHFKFSGTINNETIEQMMEAIKLASSFDYRIDERDIWISMKQ